MGSRQAELLFGDFVRWGFDVRGWAASTRHNYDLCVRRCDAYLRSKTPRSIFSAHERDLRKWIATLPPTASSRNQGTQALKGFYAFLKDQDWRDDNPAADLAFVKPPKMLPKALTAAQIADVLQASKVFGPMAAALINCYAYTGLRHSEVRCREWNDWGGKEWMRVAIPKQNKERDVYIHPEAQKALRAWRQKCDSPTWIFPSPKNGGRKPISDTWVLETVRAVGSMAGIAGLHPHIFRHSVAVHLLTDRGWDTRTVQLVLGHETIASTEKYLLLKPERQGEAWASVDFAKGRDR